MGAGPAVESAHRDGLSLAERAAAILRDEIANGALANIGVAGERWSAMRSVLGPTTPSAIDRPDDLIRTVLELVAPTGDRHSTTEPVLALRAANDIEPGGSAVITLAVQNDRASDVELSFTCSDLVAPPDRRIEADRIRLVPQQVRIPAGRSADLAVILRAPAGALSGMYRAMIQATENPDLVALLTFPVRWSR